MRPGRSWRACALEQDREIPDIRDRRTAGRSDRPLTCTRLAMKASEVMVPNPFVAVANAAASEVAIMFRTRNISVVPVVDDHRTRRFLGVVSDRDLVTRCLAVGAEPGATRADAIMRTESAVVGPDTELAGFSLYMNQDPNESHLRPTITVVDSEHRVIGFISHPEQVEGLNIIWR